MGLTNTESRDGFERQVQVLVGLTLDSVDYWDLHNFGDEPVRWDYGTWHHAVMGAQLNTSQGPFSVVWTSRFFPYGVEVFRSPITSLLAMGEYGPERVGPDGKTQWAGYFGRPITGASTNWSILELGPSVTSDGRVVEPSRVVELPTAIRLDLPTGSVWFVAALPNYPDMTEFSVPGDEILVVFDAGAVRSIGVDPWF